MKQDDFERQLTKRELKLARQLRDEINRAIRDVSEKLTVEAYQQTQHEEQVKQLLLFEQSATLTAFMSLQAEELAFDLTPSMIERIRFEFIQQNTLNHSKLIADTTFERLRKTLIEGMLSEDVTPRNLSKKILEVKKLTKPRALMIARTETHNAAIYAQYQVSVEYEQYYGERLYKQWAATKDKRVRDTHRAMTRHPIIPMNQAFTVGGSQMLMPGDSSLGAPAREIINCRCGLRYYKESELKDLKL